MQNTNPYIVITGASAGIGREAAKAFAKRGKNLILAARREDRLVQLKEELVHQYPSLDVVLCPTDLQVSENVYAFYAGLKAYPIETFINNAGIGYYSSVSEQDLQRLQSMLRLDVEALAILSSLYVRDYKHVSGAQLINVSSGGGYTIVPNCVSYCAAKFFVSTFTEGLARELKAENAKLRAKVFAPAATKTEFGAIANDRPDFDYDKVFGLYHTAEQVAGYLLELWESDKTLGIVNRETFAFSLSDPVFPNAWDSARNQKI